MFQQITKTWITMLYLVVEKLTFLQALEGFSDSCEDRFSMFFNVVSQCIFFQCCRKHWEKKSSNWKILGEKNPPMKKSNNVYDNLSSAPCKIYSCLWAFFPWNSDSHRDKSDIVPTVNYIGIQSFINTFSHLLAFKN